MVDAKIAQAQIRRGVMIVNVVTEKAKALAA